MALTQVTGPYPIFTDLDGTPLDDGYLYIGAINQDPEQNPIQVFWDANLTIAATQPIRTSNGYAYRNGTPALLYTGGEFSITIRNKREEFVLYSPVGYGFDPAAVSASVVKNDFTGNGVQLAFVLSASPSTILATNIFINGVYQEKDSYTLAGNTITFSIAPPLNSSIEVMTNETGVINTGNATAISYTASFAGATLQTVQTKLEQYVSVKDFGAVGDGVTDDTAAIQDAIDAVSDFGGKLFIPAGVYNHTGLLIVKPINIEGENIRGPVYGVANNSRGTILQYTATTATAVQIDATSYAPNAGLAVQISSITFVGNKDVVGATDGGGITLVGDKLGETFFVQGCVFTNVQVLKAKSSAWTIVGTCFINNWYNCSSMYSGLHGVFFDKGSGSPVNNNWFGSLFNDNNGWGVYCNNGKMTLTDCNISQNLTGGVFQDSGYLILANCDLEQNANYAISVVNSSAATLISGGIIHKTPATAAVTGVNFGTGCAGNIVDGMLFANFDNAADLLVNFTGGANMYKFDYRTQNCLSSSFPTSKWTNIDLIPPKEKRQIGSITFTGSGIGTRTATITFPVAFEASYNVVLNMDASFGTLPSKFSVGVDYSTQTTTDIDVVGVSEDAGYANVAAYYIAIGR